MCAPQLKTIAGAVDRVLPPLFTINSVRSLTLFGKTNGHLSQLDVREHYYQLRNLYFLSWNDQQWVEDNGLNSKIAFAIFEFKMAATADRPFD